LVDNVSSVTTADARNQFSDVLNRAAYGQEHVILTRRGKAIAAIIPIEHLHLLEKLVEEVEDRMDLEEALRVLGDEAAEFVDWESAKRAL
jgi:prevent-host-death family protein